MSPRLALILAPLAFLATACGPVVIGTTAASLGNGGGSANAPATPAGLQVLGPKV